MQGRTARFAVHRTTRREHRDSAVNGTTSDTLSAAEALEAAGMEPAHAKAIAVAIRNGQGDLAARTDIAMLKSDIGMLKWAVGINVAITVATFAVVAARLIRGQSPRPPRPAKRHAKPRRTTPPSGTAERTCASATPRPSGSRKHCCAAAHGRDPRPGDRRHRSLSPHAERRPNQAIWATRYVIPFRYGERARCSSMRRHRSKPRDIPVRETPATFGTSLECSRRTSGALDFATA